jgi:ArsR family transcriptional regulator
MKTSTTLPDIPIRHKNETCCVAVGPSMSREQTTRLADHLKALGDPTRLRLLDLFVQQGGPMCVCDTTPHFTQNQPTISHHLRLLREAGLIDTDKRGIWSYYWSTDEGRRALTVAKSLI